MFWLHVDMICNECYIEKGIGWRLIIRNYTILQNGLFQAIVM